MAPAAKRKTSAQSSGGLGEARKQMRLDALAEENAELRERLAALQAPTKVLKYVEGERPAFLKNLSKAKGVEMLDLSELDRVSNRFDSGWYGLFPKWKPDKRLDGTVAAMVAGTEEVQGLDLGEGKWAADDQYAQELVKMLRKYSKTLTNIRVAMSTLVERYETVKSLNQKKRHKSWATITMGKSNILNVLGGMTKLSTMKLIVNRAGRDEYSKVAYAGELVPVAGKKKLFSKLNQLEVYLTDPWVRSHMGGDEGPAEDATPMAVKFYHPERHSHPDPCLSDWLQHRGDVVTHLDMVPVGARQSESPFVAQIAALPKLRSIALRAEMLGVTKTMSSLESVELHVDGALSSEAVEKVTELFSQAKSLQGLQKLKILVKQARVNDPVRPLLAAVGQHCRRLAVFEVTGSGWLEEDLTALLQGPAAGSLSELLLAQCGAVGSDHLPIIAALPKLTTLRLPSRLLGAPGAADVKKMDLDLQWRY